MKKAEEKLSKKKLDAKAKSKLSKLYILIAAVAILECLILISFTTFSWIETASSLIIKTGHKYYDDTLDTRIPIANALNYKFIVKNSNPDDNDLSDLNAYFSYSGESATRNLYRFARASSADGRTFYFPKGNGKYRLGDIIDSNANFTHFDFVVSNKGAASNHKLKFYFKDASVFQVSKGTSQLTDTQIQTVQSAMRISFQTGSGKPKIYALSSSTPDNFYGNAVTNTDGFTSSTVPLTKIKADPNQKLFTVGKNSEQNISVRIWLEDKALGSISAADLAGADIRINLQLTYAENDYDFLYFDDYTFSSGILDKDNIGGHLTEEDNSAATSPEYQYRMYFVYRENNNNIGYVYPMTVDDSGSNTDAHCWVTCDGDGNPASTIPDITGKQFITQLTTQGRSALQYSYFAYGVCKNINSPGSQGDINNLTTALYKWELNGLNADDSVELRYNGYSVTETDSDTYGLGGWAKDTPLSLVYFRDLATGVTTNNYNDGDNFKYITKAVNAADTTTTTRSNVMYVNRGLAPLTDAAKAAQAKQTATMYYDKSADNGNGLFKTWVPTAWLSGSMRFSYCPDGKYSNCCISWDAGTPSKPAAANDYIYTALGCSQNYDVAYYSGTVNSGRNDWINPGSGTWREIESEPVYFSTELIDNYATASHRYQIGVKIEGSADYSYYHLVPDATKQHFYAYLPKAGTNTSPAADYAAGSIMFREFAQAETHDVSAYWLGNARKGSNTFYPVKNPVDNTDIATEPTTDYTRGYWNISVIVDGTYEHFFWDYGLPSTTEDDKVLGEFSYNTVGHTAGVTYENITVYKLDEYRWYVPLDDLSTIPEYIYYKWEPYTNTVFTYSQKLSDGIYCVITEAPDNTPEGAFS